MKVDIFTTNKKYDIIYADPPWSYNDKLGKSTKWGAMTYPTMTDKEICDMPIEKIASKDSVLFMWTTMPKMQDALNVIKSWGFKYKTCAFCWVKQNPKTAVYMPDWDTGSRGMLNCVFLPQKVIHIELVKA